METIYNEKRDPGGERYGLKPFLAGIGVVFAALFLVFLLNRGLWFWTTRATLKGIKDVQVVTNINPLARRQELKDRLIRQARQTGKNATVMMLFPRFSRLRLMFFTKKNQSLVNLGLVSIMSHAGMSQFTLFGPDYFRLYWYGDYRYHYFGNTPLDPFFRGMMKWTRNRGIPRTANDFRPVFASLPYESVPFYRLIFSLYLVLPLLGILYLVATRGKAMYTAVIYYGFMVLLFGARDLFYGGTAAWLETVTGIDIPLSLQMGWIVLIGLVFALLFLRGVVVLVKQGVTLQKGMFFLFFILLPLVLRF